MGVADNVVTVTLDDRGITRDDVVPVSVGSIGTYLEPQHNHVSAAHERWSIPAPLLSGFRAPPTAVTDSASASSRISSRYEHPRSSSHGERNCTVSLLSILLPAGAAAIKIALRLADPTAPNVADSIDDFSGVYSRVADEVHRRRLTRHSQDMVDEVARRLARELDAEYHGIDDRDLLPAVSAVTAATNKIFPLADRERVDIVRSSDPQATLFRLIESRANIAEWERQHGERIASLAHSILRDVCHATAAILRKHPDLSIDMLAYLAQRSEDLARVVDDVRESVASIPHRLSGANDALLQARVEAGYDQFTVEYLRSVAGRFDQLELYGLDLKWEAVHYSLTTSYVSLRLGGDISSAHHSNLARALNSKSTLYLRGPAGSGKTTILQWLAVGMARQSLPTGYGHISSSIPIVIRLRNFTEGPLPGSAELAKITAPMTILNEPPGWLQFIGVRRGIVLLIDGVDEFPDERRSDLLRWLHDVTHSLHPRTIVLTGRPSAESVAQAITSSHTSAILDIQPMSREEIRSFVIHWHTSLARNRSRRAAEAIRVADLLCGSREYRSLASTPLLCAALCALFHVRNGSIPASRIAIYKTLIRLLLSQRDDERGIRVDAVDLDVEQRQFVLEQLAMFMLANNLTEVDASRALPVVERALKNLQTAVDAPALFRNFVRRSGVIREIAEGKVDFVHRAFLEFLAASAHVALDTVEALATRSDDQNYADAAILAGGLANVTQFRAMVATIMAKWDVDQSPKPPMWLTRMAAGLLAVQQTRIGEEKLTLVGTLERSLPPESGEAVRAVTSAGVSLFTALVDAVVAHPYAPNDTPLTGVLIRSIGEHGGDGAFAALKRIPNAVRLMYLDDLLAIWSWFDLESFARELLADLKPTQITRASISTSRVFPYLGILSSNFRWTATLPFPDESLTTDCQNAPIDHLVVEHLDLLEDEASQRCDFVCGLKHPRVIIIRRAPSFDPHGPSTRLAELERLSIEVSAGGKIVLDKLVDASGLTNLAIAGGTIERGSSPDSPPRFEGSGCTVSLLDGAEVEPDLRVRARVVKLRDVESTTARAVATSALFELEVRSQTRGLDLDSLESAINLEALYLENCRELDNLATIAALPRLRIIQIRGDCRLNDVDAILAIRDSVDTVDVDDDVLANLLGGDDHAILRSSEVYGEDSEAADGPDEQDYSAYAARQIEASDSPYDSDEMSSDADRWTSGDQR